MFAGSRPYKPVEGVCKISVLLVNYPFNYSFCRFLLLKYKAHINVEVVGSVGAIKYLFKYITKGPDRVMVEKDFRSKEEIDHDEITQHINASWYVYFLQGF